MIKYVFGTCFSVFSFQAIAQRIRPIGQGTDNFGIGVVIECDWKLVLGSLHAVKRNKR